MKKEVSKKWYQSVSNWVVIVACVILVPILLINLYIIYQSKTNQNSVPSVFGYKPFIVLSGSMESDIHKGDLIITKKVDPSTLKEKDVIAFRDAEGTVTTHRIIDIIEKDGNTYFITKGDNNNTQDRNLVSLDDVEGKYIGRIPGIGSMMKALSEPTTIIILVLGITIVFGIGFAISTKKQAALEREEFMEYKKMKEKTKKLIEHEDDEEYLEYLLEKKRKASQKKKQEEVESEEEEDK